MPAWRKQPGRIRYRSGEAGTPRGQSDRGTKTLEKGAERNSYKVKADPESKPKEVNNMECKQSETMDTGTGRQQIRQGGVLGFSSKRAGRRLDKPSQPQAIERMRINGEGRFGLVEQPAWRSEAGAKRGERDTQASVDGLASQRVVCSNPGALQPHNHMLRCRI